MRGLTGHREDVGFFIKRSGGVSLGYSEQGHSVARSMLKGLSGCCADKVCEVQRWKQGGQLGVQAGDDGPGLRW